MTPWQSYEFILLALTVWRESRGETQDARRGVAWSIRNRVLHPGWWGGSWVGVILKPWQYSSFNAGDANAAKFPAAEDAAWDACLAAATEAYHGDGEDPTGGAVNYFDRSLDGDEPKWATDGSYAHTVNLGNLRFYRGS